MTFPLLDLFAFALHRTLSYLWKVFTNINHTINFSIFPSTSYMFQTCSTTQYFIQMQLAKKLLPKFVVSRLKSKNCPNLISFELVSQQGCFFFNMGHSIKVLIRPDLILLLFKDTNFRRCFVGCLTCSGNVGTSLDQQRSQVLYFSLIWF